jgi:crotonobetainyl-CoA:carnitine CoA-transferase CaiB-like acyl-CoA transferase
VSAATGLLADVRVIEVSLLGPDALAMHLADLGADVIKVEDPNRPDYIRVTGPIVDGISLLHRRWNRGKRSLALDLRAPDGQEVFRDLVQTADVVVEGLRPGALDRLGLGAQHLQALRPELVVIALSGFGQYGPCRDLPSHGLAFDGWAGNAAPEAGPGGMPSIPEYRPVAISAAPLYGALAAVSAVLHARATGVGGVLDLAQADCAAVWNTAIEEARRIGDAPRAPEDSMSKSVRYQYYETSDRRYILFMATERHFWERFATALGREELLVRFPAAADFADRQVGNLELRRVLAGVFRERTQRDWVSFFLEHDIPGVPVNATPQDVLDDPHFSARMAWLPESVHGIPMMATPTKGEGVVRDPRPAPAPGQHTREILTDMLGYDRSRVDGLMAAGVVASPPTS